MPLDLSHPALHIIPQPSPLHLHQYPISSTLPEWTTRPLDFFSVIRTLEEVSIVYSHESRIHDDTTKEYEGPWRALRVRGPMELTMTGVLATLTAPLKDAEVPIFALSTWSAQFSVTRLTADARNTDYVLIPWEKTDIALAALEQQGWKVVRSNTA